MGQCGHILKSEHLQHKDSRAIRSLDGKALFPYQQKGVDFVESSGGRCLIADEMGLGKTVQALGFLALHQEALPALFVVKKVLGGQWQHETMRWIGEDHFAQWITDSRTDFLPGLKYYIISYDLIPRIKDFKEKVEARGIQTLIIDECQQIKNPTSKRTVAIKELSRAAGIKHIIGLSGTPIKNNAIEYFPILNILKPEIFSRLAQFQQWWCQSYWNGRTWKSGALANPDLFKEKTKSFIIRRSREEVMPELPKVDRRFSFHELGEEVEQAYIDTMRAFQSEVGLGSAFEQEANILAYLSKMRHLVGLSKIDPCVDKVMEFLGSTDRKITIFVHHKDVAEILEAKLSSLMKELELDAPVSLSSKLSAEQRSNVIEKFVGENGPRVLIASTLASGEGLNLQTCSDCIMMERQWNPANEEQAEGRFARIGQKASSITATYMVAIGTVDEFFSEIVEQKRAIVAGTLDFKEVSWNESSIMKELTEILMIKGGQKWGF